MGLESFQSTSNSPSTKKVVLESTYIYIYIYIYCSILGTVGYTATVQRYTSRPHTEKEPCKTDGRAYRDQNGLMSFLQGPAQCNHNTTSSQFFVTQDCKGTSLVSIKTSAALSKRAHFTSFYGVYISLSRASSVQSSLHQITTIIITTLQDCRDKLELSTRVFRTATSSSPAERSEHVGQPPQAQALVQRQPSSWRSHNTSHSCIGT